MYLIYLFVGLGTLVTDHETDSLWDRHCSLAAILKSCQNGQDINMSVWRALKWTGTQESRGPAHEAGIGSLAGTLKSQKSQRDGHCPFGEHSEKLSECPRDTTQETDGLSERFSEGTMDIHLANATDSVSQAGILKSLLECRKTDGQRNRPCQPVRFSEKFVRMPRNQWPRRPILLVWLAFWKVDRVITR